MGLLDAFSDPQFRRDLGTNAKQLGQSASNTIAEGVTMPVDALAWLLRRGRVPVPQNPIGGSDWVKQMGLMADVPQGAPKMAGEALGLLAPLMGTKQGVNAMATALRQGGENLAARRTMNPQTGAIVWHGSPHKFDKFDASKIGTGEGAQAYGHGLYLAESPDVANSYKSALTHSDDFVDGKLLDSSIPSHFLARILADESGNINASKQSLEMLSRPGGSKSVADSAKQALKLLEAGHRPTLKTIKPEGSLYKVDLPDEQIARMLDWDKPLSDQPKNVQEAFSEIKALKSMYPQTDAATDLFNLSDGGMLLRSLFKDEGNNSQIAARSLNSLGVPGVRYLDGGSRGAGQGSSNFVVFPGNENMLRILERNGQPLGLLK